MISLHGCASRVGRSKLVVFVTTRGHAYTVRAIIEQKMGATAPVSRTMTYDDLFKTEWVPRATFVFTDLERLYPWEARLAADVFRSLKFEGLRCLNDPARVLTRYELLRALHRRGINPFDVYRAEDRPKPQRFPVFVRGEGPRAGRRPAVIPGRTGRLSRLSDR